MRERTLGVAADHGPGTLGTVFTVGLRGGKVTLGVERKQPDGRGVTEHSLDGATAVRLAKLLRLAAAEAGW